jgi:murein DD-endopeptidase MepM/ murein hydrolase activator NlpD
MTDYLLFLIESSSVLAILLGFYYVLLAKLTFHRFNRWVLLAFIPLSILIPQLDFGLQPLLGETIYDEQWFEETDGEAPLAGVKPESINPWKPVLLTLEYLYWIGFVLYLLFLTWNVVKLFHIKRSSEPVNQKGYTLYKAKTPMTFSCFRWVFIPEKDQYDPAHPILKHEEAHVRLFHTLDLIFTELWIAVFWFNPFVFLFRKLLKSTHEFQADDYVLGQNIKRSQYLSIMAESLIPHEAIRFSSHFNGLTIKNRIEMITKNKSSKKHSIRYLLMAPLCAILLMAFAASPGGKPSMFPIKEGQYKKISSKFGNRKNPETKKVHLHGGIDISANSGTSVMATGDGVITKSKMENKWGNLVIIDHGNGYETWYAHLESTAFKAGKKVKAGDIIGRVGNTGLSFGPHLHYEVRLNGERVNPELYYSH